MGNRGARTEGPIRRVRDPTPRPRTPQSRRAYRNPERSCESTLDGGILRVPAEDRGRGRVVHQEGAAAWNAKPGDNTVEPLDRDRFEAAMLQVLQ